MTPPACSLPRPTNTDEVGWGPRQRPLFLVQRWTAPSGAAVELAIETHGQHAHLWWRGDGDWELPALPGGDEDQQHFADHVWPVARDVVDALRDRRPVDASSAELLPSPRVTP